MSAVEEEWSSVDLGWKPVSAEAAAVGTSFGETAVASAFFGRTARGCFAAVARGEAAPSGAACAKEGCIGRMQRPAELVHVPIPEYLQKASEGFGRLRKASEGFEKFAAFWKNPEKHLVKI